ncbi:MAG: glycosyltransferase family 1 protein [Aristaeellaceae bacterium]
MNENARILHMIGSLGIGGSQAFVMNLYRRIDRNRLQFDFIVDTPERNNYAGEIAEMGGKVYCFPKFNGRNYFEIRRAWRRFLEEHREYRVLHSHVRSYASIYLPIARSYGLKTIIHSHNNSNGRGALALGKCILQLPLRFQADYYMACSQDAGKWLFGNRVCRSGNFRVINNAIDAAAFTFCEQNRAQVRLELGLKDAFVLGYLARVTAGKNPLFAIDVMAELVKLIPDARLLFVGDGELLTAVKARVAELGIQRSVVITGERTDAGRLYAAMDCYILPSLWEGLGISLIEAQAAGLRCICSEGIQDEAIVSDLVERYPLRMGAKAWAERIASMQQSRARPDMSGQIRAAGFDIAENAERLQGFYEKLCRKE